MILESERVKIGAMIEKKIMRHDDNTVYVDHPTFTATEHRKLFNAGWKKDHSYHNESVTFIRETTTEEQEHFDQLQNIEERMEELAEESKRIDRCREPGPAYGILDDARKEAVHSEYETLYEAYKDICGLATFSTEVMKYSGHMHRHMDYRY